MFNLGFSEIVIIGILALVLIGPKQLPEVAKVLGRMMKEFKQATKDLSGGLLEVKEELKKPMQDGMAALHDLETEVYKPHDETSTASSHEDDGQQQLDLKDHDSHTSES
jgi:TatA/E family protein of Tat protein translocase